MSLVKTLVKLALLAALVAAVAGAVMVLRRPDGSSDVATDEWPDVPQNPAA